MYSIPPVRVEDGQFDDLIHLLTLEVAQGHAVDPASIAEREGFADDLLAIEQLARGIELVCIVKFELLRASGVGRN